MTLLFQLTIYLTIWLFGTVARVAVAEESGSWHGHGHDSRSRSGIRQSPGRAVTASPLLTE